MSRPEGMKRGSRRGLGRRLTPLLLVGGLGCVAPATHAETGASDRRPGPGARGLDVAPAEVNTERLPLWSFSVAAPIGAPPALSPNGGVVFGSSEGYVHALGPEGGFLWSYTTKGSILGAPAVDDRGRIYVATSEHRIYALAPDGSAVWVHPSQVDFASAGVWDPRGFVAALGRDNHLWAISSRSGILWRLKIPAPATTSPLLMGGGHFLVGTEQGVFRLGLGPARRFAGTEPVSQLEVAGKDALIRSQESLLWWREGQGEVLRLEKVAFAALGPGAELVVVRRGGVVEWWSGAGQRLEQRTVEADVSAAPAVGPNSEVYVPTIDGRLLFVPRGSEPWHFGRVGRGLVHRPIIDRKRRRVIAASADGGVAGFELYTPPKNGAGSR